MSDYYDKQGNPIDDMHEWAKLFGDWDYKRVALDTIEIEGCSVDVSTVWLGLDHGFGNGAPVIFESMLFVKPDGPHEFQEWMTRYTTVESAESGHARIVDGLRVGRWPA
jgi:hypothetical protein